MWFIHPVPDSRASVALNWIAKRKYKNSSFLRLVNIVNRKCFSCELSLQNLHNQRSLYFGDVTIILFLLVLDLCLLLGVGIVIFRDWLAWFSYYSMLVSSKINWDSHCDNWNWVVLQVLIICSNLVWISKSNWLWYHKETGQKVFSIYLWALTCSWFTLCSYQKRLSLPLPRMFQLLFQLHLRWPPTQHWSMLHLDRSVGIRTMRKSR